MAKEWIRIDGSKGEGGGQILRTALSLSLATGRPLEIENIRGGRKKPGLLRQHLTALKLAARIGAAEVAGGELGSLKLSFVPQGIRSGHYEAAVGTAGSATLVAQTVLPALALGDGPSTLHLEGGTHNPFAPPFDFLERVYLPALRSMGVQVDATLERAGFFPAGGGRMTLKIQPVTQAQPFECLERGGELSRSVRILNAGISKSVPERERLALVESFGWEPGQVTIEGLRASWGPGNVVLCEVEFEGGRELITAFGRRGVRAEGVAQEAQRAFEAYLDYGAPVGEHLADQLLLPMALLGGGAFITGPPTLHTRTNAEVISAIMPIDIDITPLDGPRHRVSLYRRP